MTDLPPGWEWVTLDDVADIQGGIQKQPERTPKKNRYPFLRVANVLRGELNLADVHEIELFEGEPERYLLAVGDLLVVEGNGSVSQIGRSARWRGEVESCVHQNHLIRVRPLSGIVSEFLDYQWNSEFVAAQLRSVAGSSSGLHTLSVGKLKRVRLALPPSAVQRRIVEELDTLLARVDLGARSLQYAWARARTAKKSIIADAVPSQAPSSWKVVSVAEAGRVDLGRQRHPDWHYGDNMKPYLRVANVFEDRIDLSDVMKMHFSPAEFERFRLVPGDILLNEGQSPEYLGRPAIYTGEPAEVAFTNSLLRFKANADVRPEWALLVFLRHLHSGRFQHEVRITTNIAHLSAGRFKSVEFPIPSLQEQKRLVEQVRERLADIERASNAIRIAEARSATLRQSLLAEAFAGRLVPQDPADEPASVLLDRIRAERASQPISSRRGRTRGGQG